jgi:glycosyltransferase involved in cell wall biosynthesis
MEQDDSKPLNVCFLTLGPFPFGMAQTNRLISIAVGLVNSGCRVKVICLKPTENQRNSLNNQSAGEYNGIKFAYASGTTYRGKNTIRRIYLFIKGICLSSYLLFKENKHEKIHFLFIGVTGFLISFWFLILCKVLHIKYLQERSEYPFIKAQKSLFDKPSLFLYLKITCKLFDGFLVITKKLQEYFKPHLRKNCPVFLLPILVEPERFFLPEKNDIEKYIAYCGSMQGDKDGIPILIDAYKLFYDEFPNVKLYLIGSTQFVGFNGLKEKINLLALNKNIVFTGIADRNMLPEILSKAIMLVLARPNNVQAEAGFPTKLGEYLATGKPVVVTNVGEITDYLQDNINAYIAVPGDAKDFASKMKQVMNNYKQALKVGIEGQCLAQTIFNSTFQGKKLVAWLRKI